MDTEKHTPADVVAEALEYARKAVELRGAAIKHLLEQREQIDRDLATLGYGRESSNGHHGEKPKMDAGPTDSEHGSPKRFKNLKLADIGRVLLTEHGKLHGKEIERLAKAGGFKGGTKNFQNYMPVAFKRDGGFENVGGNTWRLKRDSTT